MSLKHTYTLIAPFYDLFLDAATAGSRRRSLAALGAQPASEVLLVAWARGSTCRICRCSTAIRA